MIKVILGLAFCGVAIAQSAPQFPEPGTQLNAEQLDNLVAPVALYPDPLLSQVLVAATYPLELVQAYQWQARNPGLRGAALTQAAQQQNWDPSIQALVLFPDVVNRLNADVTWTTNLGNAFLSQENDVMDAVQRMRQSAQQSGRLASSDQQTVRSATESGVTYIVIEPADPQIIYVPEYDPFYIWGAPLYYPYAVWPHRRYSSGIYFGFGGGISIGAYFGGGWGGGWGNWGWTPGWGGRRIIVNNNFIHRNNFNSGAHGTLAGRSDWSHDTTHRQGVPYSTPAVSARFGGNVRQNLQPRGFSTPVPGGVARVPQSDGARIGARQIPPNSQLRNPGAFGGIRDGGAAARAQSDHGFSRLGPARSNPAPVRAEPQQNRPPTQQPRQAQQQRPQQQRPQQQRPQQQQQRQQAPQPNRGGNPPGRPERK